MFLFSLQKNTTTEVEDQPGIQTHLFIQTKAGHLSRKYYPVREDSSIWRFELMDSMPCFDSVPLATRLRAVSIVKHWFSSITWFMVGLSEEVEETQAIAT